MTNILLFEYYYKYRQERQIIKNIADSNDYQAVKTKLDVVISEYEQKYPPNNPRRDFNYGEKLILNHVRDHLDAVIDQNDPSYIDLEGNIKHQSDIVKESLEEQPKQDYSD